MKELVEVIAKALVDHPEEVSVMRKRKAALQCLSCMWQTATWER